MRETVELNRQVCTDFAEVCIFQPYPGTRAEQYCREKGYLDEAGRQFESIYVSSVLKIDPAFRQCIYILHKFFNMIVRHPWLWSVVRRLPKSTVFNPLWTLLYRLNYGYSLHRHAYASVIPLSVRLRGAYDIVLSRNRI